MRKFFVIAFLIVGLAGFASAQDSKVDVFGGYQYTRVNPGSGADGFNFNGWNAAVQYNLSQKLGVVADFSGAYKKDIGTGIVCVQLAGINCPTSADTSVHTFLFGPSYSFKFSDDQKVKPFVHALFGVARAKVSTSAFEATDSAFSTALGGGIDYNVSKNFSIRAIQADYLLTRFGGDNQNNTRLSFGVVFHF